MLEREQIGHLEKDIDSLISRYCQEYELTYASVIGVLQMKIIYLAMQAKESDDDSEPWRGD